MENTRKYRFPRFYKGLAFAGLFFFAAILAWTFSTNKQFTFRSISIPAAICIPLIVGCIKLLSMVDDEVVVDEQGVRYIQKKGPSVYLPWDQIGKIVAHDIRQRLQLYDMQGRKKINLEYQLANFEELRETVFRNTKNLKRANSKADNVFRVSYITSTFIVGSTLLIVWIVWFTLIEYVSSFKYLSLFYLLIPLYFMFFTVIKLQINNDHIIIYNILRRRIILFSEINKIYIRNSPDRYGNIHANVIVEYAKNKKVEISKFREGSFSVYSSLETAWNSMKKGTI